MSRLAAIPATLLAIALAACSAPTPATVTPPPAATAVASAEPTLAPTQSPETSPTSAKAAPSEPSPTIALTPLVRANRATRTVEFDAVAVLDVGFLEQFVCLAGTREHESLFAFEGRASDIHAALLFVGLEPGAPGSWRRATADESDPDSIVAVAPSGPELKVEVIVGAAQPEPIASFIRAAPLADGAERLAAPIDSFRFVFAGSRLRRDRRTGEDRYIADGSGSLVGLVTFGDETIAAASVIPDQIDAASPVWEVDPARMPAVGTKVIVRLRAVATPSAPRPPPHAESTSN